MSEAQSERDRLVRRVILVEGGFNAALLLVKAGVGFATGSMAIAADAVHSVTDLANNAVAWTVMRLSAEPPDLEHPYGHGKFETLAVFVLATLLAVLAVELGLSAFRREAPEIHSDGWALGLMLGVLGLNIAVAIWQGYWARKLDSDLLSADARHTLADVLTTVVVLIGWQLAAAGYVWLDTASALGVTVLILVLSWGLFRRVVPVLVDGVSLDAEQVHRCASAVSGVENVARIRSRWIGSKAAVDLVIEVDPEMSTRRSHEVADGVEAALRAEFAAESVVVHVEPSPAG